MLAALKRFFDDRIEARASSEAEREHALRLATAALLTEMTRQDETVTHEERQAVCEALAEKFEISPEEAKALVALAEEEASTAPGYFQFTSLINDHFTMPQKIRVVELLWRVALADNRVDTYEEHMVRKVAELLYVRHADFIAAKHRVLEARGA